MTGNYNDVYQVLLNGNLVVFSNIDYNLAYRHALKFAKDKSNYVEVWSYYTDGSRTLLNYWN